MFSYIKGTLEEVSAESVTVDTMGVGWKLLVPASVLDSLPPVGSDIKLYTSFQVREDDMTLYGFLSRQDRSMFEMLLVVSGVGPKAAMGILSALTPDQLRMAIISGDAKAISRAPGIGAKTAQRIILDLKDRISPEDIFSGGGSVTPAAAGSPASQPSSVTESIEALVTLGYSLTEATRAVRQVEGAEEMSTEAVLKESLKYL